MARKFGSAAAFKASLEAHLRKQAERRKIPLSTLQLKFVIERALILCDGPVLLPEHFPEPRPVVVGAGSSTASAQETRLEDPAADERARIVAAMVACAGNQSRAARQLGISRKVLIARLDRYGVRRPRKPGTQ